MVVLGSLTAIHVIKNKIESWNNKTCTWPWMITYLIFWLINHFFSHHFLSIISNVRSLSSTYPPILFMCFYVMFSLCSRYSSCNCAYLSWSNLMCFFLWTFRCNQRFRKNNHEHEAFKTSSIRIKTRHLLIHKLQLKLTFTIWLFPMHIHYL